MTQTLKEPQKQRLRAHFRFSTMPFSKYARAGTMYDSASQRELLEGLTMWTELKGLALVTGPSGVGKSITLRRFVRELDPARFHVVDFSYLPTTPHGFLRSLSRKLGLPMRLYTADLFDAAQKHLMSFEQERGPHPLLLLDDAEGLSVDVLDILRRLTCYDLDAQDRFSVLVTGTEDVLATLRHPQLAPLRSRIGYANTLRPFGIEDARSYVQHHLRSADCDREVFTEDAVRHIFQASHGRPRNINQLAIQALIAAAVAGRDRIDASFMKAQIANHPLYQSNPGGE